MGATKEVAIEEAATAVSARRRLVRVDDLDHLDIPTAPAGLLASARHVRACPTVNTLAVKQAPATTPRTSKDPGWRPENPPGVIDNLALMLSARHRRHLHRTAWTVR